MAKKQRQGSFGKRRRWEETIARWRASKESARAFCRREQISEPAFYYWRRRLSADAEGAEATPEESSRAFAEVQLTDGGRESNGVIELTLPGGERLRIGRDVEPAHLQRVIAAVREARGC